MAIQKIDDIYELLKGNTQKKRLVVAYANDSHSIEAVNKAVEMGIVEATLCGDENEIKKVCAEHGFDISRFKIVHEPVDTKAAAKAVQMVRDKEADFIMKGLVSTDKYMRAILNKDCGLLPPKATLSHVVVMECPNYHKLLVFSDAAIIPAPCSTSEGGHDFCHGTSSSESGIYHGCRYSCQDGRERSVR